MKKIIFLFLSLLLVSCPSSVEEKPSSLVIASWNVQNLFNATDEGTEYDEFKSSSGWEEKQYRVRLSKVEAVLGYGELSKASVIVLCEVENEAVVEDILSLSSLKKRGFEYYACAGEEGGAIKTAVISCYPIEEAFIHAFSGIRPVLEVRIRVGDKRLSLLAVHAKSNLGEEEENRRLRERAGRIIESLYYSNESDYFVVAGDFNEEVSSGCVILHPYLWYNFWEDVLNELNCGGSYRYDGTWLKYDNIVCSGGALSGGVECSGILSTIYGYPDAFSRNMLSGVSDHFPVWLRLTQ